MLVTSVKNLLNKTLQDLKYSLATQFRVWIPKQHGDEQIDVSTNLCMVLASLHKQSPIKFANALLAAIDQKAHHLEALKYQNGYLNFTFSAQYRNRVISSILDPAQAYGKIDLGQQKRLNYEWISANPTGYLHIGHARNAVLGMAISNLLEFVNYKVTREFYVNDRGKQIFNLGKSIFYAYSRQLNQPIQKVDQEIYVNAEIDEAAAELIKRVQKRYLNSDFFQNPALQADFADFGKQFFLPKIKKICEQLGIQFDVWSYESDLFQKNRDQEFLHRLQQQKLLYKKDGATWLKIGKTPSVDDDYVLFKSSGDATYFLGDLMYHANKFDRGFAMCIDLWGADHHAHYLKLQKALAVLKYPAENYLVNLMQLVKIVRNQQSLKMSKRKGTAYYLHALYNEVGNDFFKFMLLSSKRSNKFTFDIDLVKQKTTQNPLFYCQYAYARACKVLYLHQDFFSKSKQVHASKIVLNSPSERKLILSLTEFPHYIEKAATLYEPYVLIEYVQKLAKAFHLFYERDRIKQINDFGLKYKRLELTKAFTIVFKKIFTLFGISTPERI